MATIHRKAKNFNQAIKDLQQAETLSKSKEEKELVSLRRANLYWFGMKRHPEAEAEYSKILLANPENTGALNNLGYMLAERHVRLQEAQEFISRALKMTPQDGACLDSMGFIYDRLGKLDEAETYLRRAWESAAPNPVITEHLADVYFKKGKVKEAVARWRDALRECETSAPVDVDSAQIARIRKKLENAGARS
jgi:tetratricopeptide (TPR) repeat protein